MNTADMHEILKHLLDQHRSADPSAYSPIPKFIRNMGAALSRIESFESRIPELETTIAQAEVEINFLEEKFPFLILRAPSIPVKVGTLKNGEDYIVAKRNYRHDRPRPVDLPEEIYLEIRTNYFGKLFIRQHTLNRLQQYRTWIEAAYQQWHENASAQQANQFPSPLVGEGQG